MFKVILSLVSLVGVVYAACDGKVYCCNTFAPSTAELLGVPVGILSTPIQDFNIPIGAECIPVNVIGVGNGGTCTSAPVCCTGSPSSGTIAAGCNSIPINL